MVFSPNVSFKCESHGDLVLNVYQMWLNYLTIFKTYLLPFLIWIYYLRLASPPFRCFPSLELALPICSCLSVANPLTDTVAFAVAPVCRLTHEAGSSFVPSFLHLSIQFAIAPHIPALIPVDWSPILRFAHLISDASAFLPPRQSLAAFSMRPTVRMRNQVAGRAKRHQVEQRKLKQWPFILLHWLLPPYTLLSKDALQLFPYSRSLLLFLPLFFISIFSPAGKRWQRFFFDCSFGGAITFALTCT